MCAHIFCVGSERADGATHLNTTPRPSAPHSPPWSPALNSKGLATIPAPTSCISSAYCFLGLPLVAQMVENLPAVREPWVQSLGWQDPLEAGMATHSSILAWRIPMDRRTWPATVHGIAESDTTEELNTHTAHCFLGGRETQHRLEDSGL